ncbi:MAG TPA: GNAT family N-acetyltransferase [Candidatus Limnocylindria bacterium]|nr:GNAT family N-acetyltransferase [Candidatus Limnocylindria bacterium]
MAQTQRLMAGAATAADLERLVIRPYAGHADLPEIVRVANADMALDGVRVVFTLDDLAPTYRTPSASFDAARDVLMAELDGVIVGTIRVDWVDNTDGTREYRSRGHVDAPWRRRGIGRRLLAAADGLIRERAAEHETHRPRVQGMWADDRQAGRKALAESAGYTAVRWFFEMERQRIDVDRPEILPMPDGLEVRPVTVEDAPAIWAADHDAFRDHWGGWDDSEAALRRWVESPEFQPDLYLVAYDGDEIAGAVLNGILAEENEKLGLRRGWLDSVFTRRAWRGRGLARALIGRSVHLLAERGMDTAALGVDADNPSGALGLYRSCGFEVVDGGAAWRKPLEVTR